MILMMIKISALIGAATMKVNVRKKVLLVRTNVILRRYIFIIILISSHLTGSAWQLRFVTSW